MVADKLFSSAPIRPLVLLAGDERIIKPLTVQLNSVGRIQAKPINAIPRGSHDIHPVLFHELVRAENAMHARGVGMVLRFEFSHHPSDHPYFTVDTLHNSIYSGIMGDLKLFNQTGTNALTRNGFRRPSGSVSEHPTMNEIIKDMTHIWGAIADKMGIGNDVWVAFNIALSKYLGGTVHQPLWDFMLSDVGSGLDTTKKNHLVVEQMKLHAPVQTQLHDFERALTLEIPREADWAHYGAFQDFDTPWNVPGRILSYQWTFSQHSDEKRLVKAVVEAGVSWLDAKHNTLAVAAEG